MGLQIKKQPFLFNKSCFLELHRTWYNIKERFSILFTDVTYLIWNGKKHYQSTILDGYTKEIIDVKWSKFNNNKLVIDNLNDAINKIKKIKKDLNKIIIHSDHEYQYTSKDYNSKCLDNKIIISMGKNYHCADNIIIESFHSLLKKEQSIIKIINLIMNILMMLKNEINDIQTKKKNI
ncbi:DDE-type integrase/transposase/recombinase [Spiroplasma endosymbiont of Polydrusus cervinus]|uniref:DDE-type integrase/transposase/recombinase n=1 Tax=Spiroplasma endosymbiont of Polydrusus cervinus TaxID=3066287 RepID=UPI0030CF841E